ncbi:phage tail protein [Enterovibrio sp. Hal110]
MKMPEIHFKYWMGRGELAKCARALRHYWGHVEAALTLPLEKHDPLTAPIALVRLQAWGCGIDPLEREDEQIFRLRVAYAFEFARHGGETAGFKTMFARLGIDWVDIHEREDAEQWDVITIETRDADLASKNWLMNAMIRQYGRTCRRYQFNVTYPATVCLRGALFGHRAGIEIATAEDATTVAVRQRRVEHHQQLFIATLSRPQGGEQ